MKSSFYILLLILMLGVSCKNEEQSDLPLHNKRILILGNSITQNGQYVDFLEYYLRNKYPKDLLDIISIGLSGETVSGTSESGREFPRPNVRDRLSYALEEINPDIVLACYGMNDGNYNPLDSLRFKAYRDGILALKAKVESSGAKLIFMTPTVFDPNPINNRVLKDAETYTYWNSYYKYNEVLTTYSDWLLGLESDNLHVIDLHHHLKSILAEMKQIKADSTFIPDGVHPSKIGHFFMAQKIIKDLYPEISVENPVSEIERLQSDSLYHLISKRRSIRSEGWLNYIGYTKGDTVKAKTITPTTIETSRLEKEIAKLLN